MLPFPCVALGLVTCGIRLVALKQSNCTCVHFVTKDQLAHGTLPSSINLKFKLHFVCHDKTLNQQYMLAQARPPPMINHLTS